MSFLAEERERTLRDLAQVGCSPRHFSGRRYFRCPKCSYLRKKKRDKVLSVLADGQGFQFKCHHCDWKGGYFYEDGPSTGAQGRRGNGAAHDRARHGRTVRNFYG
jgi:hypothetical protein